MKKILVIGTFLYMMSMPVKTYAAEAEYQLTGISVNEVSSVEVQIQEKECISLTNEEILNLYNAFLESKTGILSQGKVEPQKTLEEFAEYAVHNNIIEDTPVARAAITKAVVRAEFKVVVTAGNALGYTMSAALLDHSLQDNPSVLTYGTSTNFANNIGVSTECTSIINSFQQAVNGTNKTSYTMSGTTTLNSTTDLHLALNNVNYTVSGTKSNGVWSVYITITDTYDFDYVAWKNEMTDNDAVTVINNYAAYAQSIGAIVPYTINITIRKTF